MLLLPPSSYLIGRSHVMNFVAGNAIEMTVAYKIFDYRSISM